MLKRTKWFTLVALAGTTVLFANGCLSAFWTGFRRGFPDTGSTWGRVVNVAIDAANEMVFG